MAGLGGRTAQDIRAFARGEGVILDVDGAAISLHV
jgi:hypothetical protein